MKLSRTTAARSVRATLVSAALVLVVTLTGVAPAAPAPWSRGAPLVVDVLAPTDAERMILFNTDLDVVFWGPFTAEVWLHGAPDTEALTGTGLRYEVIDTTASQAALDAARAAEAAQQAAVDDNAELGSPLPTGRVAYRFLEEVNADLVALAEAHPDRVELFELPHPSLLGKTVYGVEIGHDVHVESGKPVFLLSGVHHAREWPTAEFTSEFAWDVLTADGNDPRVTALLSGTKLIIVPLVNPDGFDISRRLVHEQKRKNCRVVDGQIPTEADCESAAASNAGVDPNRNYGTFWNGPGSGDSTTASNYRGAGPYSEPEIQNVAELTAQHQIHVAIHNHTPDGRLLRAPSSPEEPEPVDVVAYDELAQRLGSVLGWPAGPWPEIYYVASGVAEEHAYYTTGIYGFTTEATPGHSGLERFHPPYQNVIDQYFGIGNYEGSSIREAFLVAWEAATDTSQHSVLTGTAAAGVELAIAKDITVTSSCAIPGSVEFLTCPTLPDGSPLLPVETSASSLRTTLTVGDTGSFVWHVQPSLRPSQYASEYLDEAWTVSCVDGSGATAVELDVTIGRGENQEIDVSGCPPPSSP